MPINTRGRSGSGARSTSNRFGFFTSYGSGNFGRSSNNGNNRRNSARGRKMNTSASTTNTSAYRNVCNTMEKKINSYKTLCNQAQGPAPFGRPSPTTLNTFANWVNKGAIVQMCTSAQIARWARSTNTNFNTRSPSTSACKNVLGRKFGRSTIKAVARTKNGQFMVATSPTCNGRPFCFPR